MTDISGSDDFVVKLTEESMAELGEFADRFAEAQGDPERLVAELLEDNGFRSAMARADARPHLLRWFQEVAPGWQEDPRRSGPLGRDPDSGSERLRSVGTSWTFSGIHAADGTVGGTLASGDEVEVVGFNGLLATGREVTVRGYTVMAVEQDESTQEDRLSVDRHVDWTGLFGQLGLTLNWRIPIDDPDPDS